MDKKRKLTEFAIECKKRMIEKQITQKKLAESIGTSSKYLDLIFHGDRSGNKYLDDIGVILDIDISKFKKKIA